METPAAVVDLMVDKLFSLGPPHVGANLLDPGSGTGVFIDGVLRWCERHNAPVPKMVAVEAAQPNLEVLRQRFGNSEFVTICDADFLSHPAEQFDYVIANPPYVPITGLNPGERLQYRRQYQTARNRFDLYVLFFERGVQLLKPSGSLVFITPEKFLYVETAAPLRRMLSALHCEELHFLDEMTFGELITYPLITTVRRRPATGTRVRRRDGSTILVQLSNISSSWLPVIQGATEENGAVTLDKLCTRISCGVATGADSVFVHRTSELSAELLEFAYPTISGRQLIPNEDPKPEHSLLVPYDRNGRLLPVTKLGALGRYLSNAARKEQLLARTCVTRKPWYAYHETPPLQAMLRPKLLCKDIGAAPFFTVDRAGTIIPRHSVYYIVPSNPDVLDDLMSYLNSMTVQKWLWDHCQRAANNFVRLQSHVLKKVPLPAELAEAATANHPTSAEIQPSLL